MWSVFWLLCSLWQLLQSENSHVASVATPLLIHCLAQPTGANVFWELVENDFNSEDWKVRFSAGWCTCCVTFLVVLSLSVFLMLRHVRISLIFSGDIHTVCTCILCTLADYPLGRVGSCLRPGIVQRPVSWIFQTLFQSLWKEKQEKSFIKTFSPFFHQFHAFYRYVSFLCSMFFSLV